VGRSEWRLVTEAVWKRPAQFNFGRKWPFSASFFAIFLLLIDLRPRKFIELLQRRDLRSVFTQPGPEPVVTFGSHHAAK
jgi:hypothetical protein